MPRRAVAIAAVLAIPLAAGGARAASVTGSFIEKNSATPLAGVTVVVRSARDSAIVAHTPTNRDGTFQLDSLAFGRYFLRASLLGYEPYTRNPVVLSESAPAFDLGQQSLAIVPIALKGLETSTRRAAATIASDRNIYLARDLPAASAGTATDLLRAVPELDVDIDDRVSLRGSSSVTIHINGRESPLKGEALTAFLRQYPASRIERVEVIANPSAKFDPEGMSGIVNLVTKEQIDIGLSGSVFAMLGDRGSGPSSRLAWQKGRLTLYGGGSGFWGRFFSLQDDERQNLAAQPPTGYQMDADIHRRNGFGNFDASADFAISKRSTLYATTSGSLSSSTSSSVNDYLLSDSPPAVTSRYARYGEGDFDWRSGSVTTGFRRVIEASRNEWTVELRQNVSKGSNASGAVQHYSIPVDSVGEASAIRGETDTRERSLQVDDVYPLGAKGKLEVGLRGEERRNAGLSRLLILSGGPGGGTSDYVHREVFYSGYLTAGSVAGRLSFQVGARAEAASTTFDVVPTATRFDSDYQSLFPSASFAWDFGRGRKARLAYSKRIERPVAHYLNPDVPSADPLNRFSGNPNLRPKYTHSMSVEASWTGSRGMLQISPFLRETVDNWDQFKIVDSLGAAVTTYRNASSIRFYGTSLVASLRQTGRLGGTLNLSVYRERHDASNFAELSPHDATNWSANGSVTGKLTSALELQAWARYNPAQTYAQGRMSANFFLTTGARLKLNEKTWASLFVNDPFNVWKYTVVTSDATHAQTSVTRGSMRRVSLSLSWSWGKPPEAKLRRPADDARPDGAGEGN